MIGSLKSKRLRGAVQIAVSLILLALILRQIHWSEVRAALLQMRPAGLAIAWVLFLAGIVVRAARWRILLGALGVRRPLGELTLWYFVGSFFNVLLPTGFGGDAVRVVELAQDTSRPGRVLNSVLVDRYMGIMVLLAMGLGAGLARPGLAPPGVLTLTGLLFFGGLAVGWMLRWPRWTTWISGTTRAGRLLRMTRLPALADAVAPYSVSALARALLVSLVFNMLQIGWNLAIAWGLGLQLPLAFFLISVPLTAVALLLPAFGGLGVRELSYVKLFAGAGVPDATAFALSLSVYMITVASGLVGGALYLVEGIRRARRPAGRPRRETIG